MANRLNIIELQGNKYNHLTLINEVDPHITFSGHIHRVCLFKCDCGALKKIQVSAVLNNITKSCGCFSRKETSKRMSNINKKHGLYGSPEYNTWRSMKKRCLNKRHKSFKDYGGRGIKVCKRWIDSFQNFYDDMGDRPSKKHSLDRIDNDKGYFKENCRWATKKDQCRNQRTNIVLEANGEKKTMSEWAELLGFSWQKLHYRLFISKNTYSLEKMINEHRIKN